TKFLADQTWTIADDCIRASDVHGVLASIDGERDRVAVRNDLHCHLAGPTAAEARIVPGSRLDTAYLDLLRGDPQRFRQALLRERDCLLFVASFRVGLVDLVWARLRLGVRIIRCARGRCEQPQRENEYRGFEHGQSLRSKRTRAESGVRYMIPEYRSRFSIADS